MLSKIQSVGASTSALKWFDSYLTNRNQVVRIHSSVSDPLLKHCSIECYVDNTKRFVSFNLQDSQRILQEMNDLLQIRNWCFGNWLLLNPDKTKLIFFGSRQMISKLHEVHLSLLGKDIFPITKRRALSFTFSSLSDAVLLQKCHTSDQ